MSTGEEDASVERAAQRAYAWAVRRSLAVGFGVLVLACGSDDGDDTGAPGSTSDDVTPSTMGPGASDTSQGSGPTGGTGMAESSTGPSGMDCSSEGCQCPGTCVGPCEINAGASCEGICMGDCSGNCQVVTPEGECNGACDGMCTGVCVLEDGGSCSGTCLGTCSGSG